MSLKIISLPKTTLGKWSIGLIIGFFALLGSFFLLVRWGERGGATFFSNLKLTIPFLLAAGCGIASFFTGLFSIIKNKERSVFVFLSSLIGAFVLYWMLAEILFPH